jgi:hypothetical protein
VGRGNGENRSRFCPLSPGWVDVGSFSTHITMWLSIIRTGSTLTKPAEWNENSFVCQPSVDCVRQSEGLSIKCLLGNCFSLSNYQFCTSFPSTASSYNKCLRNLKDLDIYKN